MKPSRRRFLQLSGVAAIATASGCKPAPTMLGLGEPLANPPAGPFQAPEGATLDLISHFLNRLSFGPRPGEWARVRQLDENEVAAAEAYLEEQLFPERIDDSACERIVARLATLTEPLGELFEYHDHVLLRELVHGTLLRAVYSKRQLYEVMVQFWSDHFNIDPSKGDCKWLKVWDDREVIRRHALGVAGQSRSSPLAELWRRVLPASAAAATAPTGRFADLVRASALSPAMLWYLDGRENRKRKPEDKPNENYARELLERHTLGVHGGYTQQDVMEVARCLTGWTVRELRRGSLNFHVGQVEFKRHWHDDGAKVVLGHRIPAGLGAGDLDRVLEIVSTHPSTARYLATKLCRRFIADEPPPSAIAAVAETFLKTEGDIQQTLRRLFHTQEFRSARANKFKRPFNYMVSALRATDAKVVRLPDRRQDGPLHQYLRRMGHAPFDYPTPDGYPEESNPWLGTLLWRWKFARALSNNTLRDAKVNVAVLKKNARHERSLMAVVLGRTPTEMELDACHESGDGLALLLSSPAFQKC